jgi:hypothetical protein
MRVILFNEAFAEAVRCGTKVQTIRVRAMVKTGEQVSLRMWACKAYRSKQVVLREAVVAGVVPVVVEHDLVRWNGVEVRKPEGLAHADGFSSWADMRDYFEREYGLPFHGWLIRWR